MSYTSLCREIEEAPVTWLPALLLLIVRACVTRKVFVDNEAMLRVVKREIDSASQEPQKTKSPSPSKS